MAKSTRKKLDFNELAKAIVDQATGQTSPEAEDLLAKAKREGKNPAAVLLGRQGGLKGGKARAVNMTASERRDAARKAARARWHSEKGAGNGQEKRQSGGPDENTR